MDLVTIHLLLLIVTAPVILYADHMGFQYLTGRVKTISPRKVEWTHRLVSIGIVLLIVTGVLITIPIWAVVLEKPLFYAKLAFVATLVLNGVFIGSLMKKATMTPFTNLSKDEKKFLLLSGAVSALGWISTTLIAFFGL
jgi:cation transport ATPase